jgi:hypothetical protein
MRLQRPCSLFAVIAAFGCGGSALGQGIDYAKIEILKEKAAHER